MSVTVCWHPIVGAIRKADDILGTDRIWTGNNDEQRAFLRLHEDAIADLPHIPELESIASLNADEINAWLAARKFNITLNPFKKYGFGTACMLDVALEWMVVGRTGSIRLASGQTVPGTILRFVTDIYRNTNSDIGIGYVASIDTKSGDVVSIARFDNNEMLNGIDLLDVVRDIEREPAEDFWGVHFPMVSLDQQPDISWLKHMFTLDTNNDLYFVDQAKQQTKLKMNQFGARVKSAAAISVMRSSVSTRYEPPALVIDGPFLLWIERPGLSMPLLVAHITPEDMKDPGSLADM
jgi:hypothetical protein